MAFETILEFDKNNRFKVKFDIGDIDKYVDDVKIDEEIAELSQEDKQTFSFCAREFYKYEGEYEGYDDDFRWRTLVWDCEYYIDRIWNIRLEDGELVLRETKHYGDIIFTKENLPEDTKSYEIEDELDTDAKYDVLITYKKLVENDDLDELRSNSWKYNRIVTKEDLDNLFTDSDNDELERLKVLVKKDNYYSVKSIPVEVDLEICKGYARETGVSDEYLTEANFNRALELTLEDIPERHIATSRPAFCSYYVKDGLIYGETKLTEHSYTIKDDFETLGKLALKKDGLGILRLYVSGEIQDELDKAKEYKDLITRVILERRYFTSRKHEIDENFRMYINKEIKNILPSVMERILTIVEVDKNREWLNKKIELAEELSQSTEVYLKTKIEVINLLEDEIKNKFKNGTSQIEYLLGSEKRMDSFEGVIGFVMEILTDLQVGKSSFSLLHKAEVMFEDKLKSVKNRYEVSLREVRSKLERLLSKYSESERENIPYSVLLDERRDEKMVQKIEEILAITKQQKLTTAEEQMVSAWNKYIGLKMEGKE